MKLRTKINFFVTFFLLFSYKNLFSQLLKIDKIEVIYKPLISHSIFDNAKNIYTLSQKKEILETLISKNIVDNKKLKKIKEIDFNNPIGIYLVEKNNNTNYFYIITDLKLNYHQINNNLIIWAENINKGEFYKKYELYSSTGKMKQKYNYFYDINLNKDELFIACFSNNYNFIKVSCQTNKIFNKSFIYIIPYKKYYLLGENLKFCILLREYIDKEITAPVELPKIKILISDKKNNILYEKNFQDFNNGIFLFNELFLDEKFREGKYKIKVFWNQISKEDEFFVLNNYTTTIDFKPFLKKFIYSNNENIKFTLYINDILGTPKNDGIVNCEIWAKKITELNYNFITNFKKFVKNGKVKFKFKPSYLFSNKYNYDVKLIYKYRGNNGIIEADYTKLKIYNYDFNVKIWTTKNLYEKEKFNNIDIFYEIKKLNPLSEIYKAEIIIYSPNKTKQSFSLKKFDSLNNFITLKNPLPGKYTAQIIVKSKQKNISINSTQFYVVPTKTQTTIKLENNKTQIFFDKNFYSYSDIAEALLIFPFNEIYATILIQSDIIYWKDFVNTKRNYLLYSFPVSDKYSPHAYFNIFFTKNITTYTQKNIFLVPPVNKQMTISINYTNNKFFFNTLNIWGHNIESDLIINTLNYDFFELYNHNYLDLFNLWYGEITPNKKNLENNWDIFYSKYLPYASLDFQIIHLKSKTNSNINIEYPNVNSTWISIFQGVTIDSKASLTNIIHTYNKKNFDIINFIPEFLNINDEVYLKFKIINFENFKNKFKFNLNIQNGKYIKNILENIYIPPNAQKNIYVYFKPKVAVTTKIKCELYSTLTNSININYIPVYKYPEVNTIKPKYLKVKKNFYKLKYKEKNNNYYSKPASIGKKFTLGDEILVEIYIKSKKDLYNLTIIDYLPAGCLYIPRENYKYKFIDIQPKLNYITKNEMNKIKILVPYLPKGKNYLYYIIKPYVKGKFYVKNLEIFSKNEILFQSSKNYYVKIDY